MNEKDVLVDEAIGILSEIHKTKIVVSFNGEDLTFNNREMSFSIEDNPIAVGDKFILEKDENDAYAIKSLLPRTSALVRVRGEDSSVRKHVLAANIDFAVIVASVKSPTFHIRQIDRYLLMCQHGNISPIICLSKTDLVDTLPDLDMYEKFGIPVVPISTVSNTGFDRLKSLLKGKCAVLTGQSGVGKSSILNQLLQTKTAKTGSIGAKTDRGTHTTSSSSLHHIDNSFYLIDTPGIRSLDLFELEKEDVKFYFSEFSTYSPQCKYKNCSHMHEPKCAVKKAVEDGSMDAFRYDSYLRIMDSLKK